MTQLALFDLDNTLLEGDSDHAWGEFLVQKNKVDPIYHRTKNDQYLKEYINGTLDIHDYIQFAVKPLIQHPLSEMLELRQAFVDQVITPMVSKKLMRQLQDHQHKKHVCVIITATNRFVTEPIAAFLKVQHLIATELEVIDDRYTGRIQGTPCFQANKIQKLNNWLNTNQFKASEFEHIWAYSDSYNDLPLLEFAITPIAVNPDQKLRAHAHAQNWSIIEH